MCYLFLQVPQKVHMYLKTIKVRAYRKTSHSIMKETKERQDKCTLISGELCRAENAK